MTGNQSRSLDDSIKISKLPDGLSGNLRQENLRVICAWVIAITA